MIQSWKVLEKVEKRADKGLYLTLVCEREGRHREAVVSRETFSSVEVGGEVGLVEEWGR